MREVKYRAWFAKQKTMADVESINFEKHATGEIYANVIAKVDYEKGGWHTKLEESTFRKTVVEGSNKQVPRVTLRQYTGLKDKNGVEIYEGDILSFVLQETIGGYYKEMQRLEPVEYSEATFWVGDFLLCDVTVEDEELMIVGNIYENPELLENN